MASEALTTELYWLTLTVLMTALMWVPYILNRIREQGITFAIWDPQGETKTECMWAERMMRSHKNAVENLIVFTPLVLIIQINQLNNELTALACLVYFFARLIHFIVLSFGIPFIRGLIFMVGVASQLILAFTILSTA